MNKSSAHLYKGPRTPCPDKKRHAQELRTERDELLELKAANSEDYKNKVHEIIKQRDVLRAYDPDEGIEQRYLFDPTLAYFDNVARPWNTQQDTKDRSTENLNQEYTIDQETFEAIEEWLDNYAGLIKEGINKVQQDLTTLQKKSPDEPIEQQIDYRAMKTRALSVAFNYETLRRMQHGTMRRDSKTQEETAQCIVLDQTSSQRLQSLYQQYFGELPTIDELNTRTYELTLFIYYARMIPLLSGHED